jgi:DNA-binding GntR family transcriptional regulator
LTYNSDIGCGLVVNMSDLEALAPGGVDAPNLLAISLGSTPVHGSTTDAVTNALREAILNGTLAPSTWLREDELSRQLNVSRTPVREALRRLSDEQLTVREVHRGTVVAPMSIDDVLAVYMVREMLEGLAAKMVARRSPAGAIAELNEIQHEMLAAADRNDTAALVRLNIDFHRVLRLASGNPYLDRFLVQVENAVRRFGASTFEQPGRTAVALQEHQAIIQAIADGDAELAEERAAEHMRRARETRIKAILGS